MFKSMFFCQMFFLGLAVKSSERLVTFQVASLARCVLSLDYSISHRIRTF